MEANRDDAALVASAKAGGQSAYRALVERHCRNVFRLAFRMTQNEQDAEDVVQETFLRAYRNIDSFRVDSGFGTWLYRIAANCSLDFVRARERRRTGPMPETGDFRTPHPGPERLAFSGELRGRIAAALAELTPMERAAFSMRHFDGLSIDEISRSLGPSSGAVKNSIFRAAAKLRQALEPVLSGVMR
jgi:RNA polymerase sigma-70 factor (ECF subfamily)